MVSRLRRARHVLVALVCAASLVTPPAFAAPAAPPVVAVSVSGNAHVPTEKILAVIKTKVGDPYDPKLVQEDLQNIFALGYFADQAPPEIRQRPGGIAVTYRVIENPVITRITFTGNAHVPADTLLALMDTAVGQVLNTNTFHQDVLKLNSYYDKVGYGGQVPTHVKDLNIEPASGVLTLAIQEGLTVRNVVIAQPPQGDPVLPPTVILPALSVKAGAPYSEELRDKDVENVKKLYEKYDLQIGDFEAGIDPATVDTKAGTADVRYTISAARVGAVLITGNSKTRDEVIRRQLRLKPGMLVTQGALRRDYERLNNLGFFEKVDLTPKPGPDPKKPSLITLDWNVKEQRTGTAQIGAGYSGGVTGQGLTGTLSFSENNINGTGNGASVRLERGTRTSNAQISTNIPYVGKTKKSQKYSFGATIFANAQNNFYPVYAVPTASPAPGATNAPAATGCTGVAQPVIAGACGQQAVTLVPLNPLNPIVLPGVVANYGARNAGVSATIGRRFTDYVTGSVGANVSRVASNATLPSGYVFNGSLAPQVIASPTSSNPFSSNVSGAQALGINAPSIAQIDSTRPFNLRSLSLGLANDTRDDVFNPRRGVNASITDEFSGRGLGSDFNYTKATLDAAKFFPVLKTATLAMHGRVGATTGAIPPNALFTFSDQELRGYSQVFYGTEALLGQVELRVPLTSDRKFGVAGFVDTGGTRIRGAAPIFDQSGYVIFANRVIATPDKYLFRSDFGVGLRFDVPQLGLRTIRLDFARGQNGAHTSFGIGQSF